MGAGPGHWRSTRRHTLSAALLLLFFATALAGGGTMARRRRSGAATEQWDPVSSARRRLVGPGSSPPTCRARCGGCAPCRAVHVAIQPGRSFPLEYYPEAWRCKCGNKLFMP